MIWGLFQAPPLLLHPLLISRPHPPPGQGLEAAAGQPPCQPAHGEQLVEEGGKEEKELLSGSDSWLEVQVLLQSLVCHLVHVRGRDDEDLGRAYVHEKIPV